MIPKKKKKPQNRHDTTSLTEEANIFKTLNGWDLFKTIPTKFLKAKVNKLEIAS